MQFLQPLRNSSNAAIRAGRTEVAKRLGEDNYARLKALRLLAPALARSPKEVRHLLTWLRTWCDGSTLTAQVPMFPFSVTSYLSDLLSKSDREFEFGSGGSSIWLSRHVQAVTSIEHNESWYRKLGEELRCLEIDNCELIFEPPSFAEACQLQLESRTDLINYGSAEAGSFERYVRTIDRFPDETFDLVVVDGRSRAACLLHALPKIKPGGLLLLDDSDRARYQAVIEQLDPWERRVFVGIRPMGGLNTTTLWTRPNEGSPSHAEHRDAEAVSSQLR